MFRVVAHLLTTYPVSYRFSRLPLRDSTTLARLNERKGPVAIVLDFVEPIGMAEGCPRWWSGMGMKRGIANSTALRASGGIGTGR